ncbi:SpaA isopeptide-forming pilin-related protein, partial [Enterococcus faecium]
WEEFDNNPADRPDQVTFEIQREHTTNAAAWKNGYIRITKPTKDTANTWERADVEKLSANSGESYQEILSLPQYNNQGQAFSYQTIKELPVPGYDSQQIDALTWKNTKQFTPLDLKITKNSSTGEKDLIGAVFKLTGDSIDTLLTDNGDGTYSLPENVKLQKEMTYTLTETKAPEGHELSKKTTWKIKIASNSTVTVDGKIVTTSDDTIQLTIENPFIEIPIAVRKYTMQGTGKEMNLKGAAFALQKKETNGAYQPMDNQTTNEKGLAIFDSLTPGEYRVVETAGPAGYDTSPGNYEFQIDKYGKIIYTGKNIETTNGMWTLTHQNRLKAFDLTVHKKEDNGQALKGAKFRLQGPEIDLELPKDGQETDTFLFENLKPGTYKLTETFTPGGYQGLKDPVTIIIKEDGSIQVEGQDYESVLSPGAKNNQISLDITNQAKVPLPETGGIGRLGIYLVGMIGCTFSIWYLFFKKERGGS